MPETAVDRVRKRNHEKDVTDFFCRQTPENCPAMRKTCKKCKKLSHSEKRKRSRSQQVSEVTSDADEECNLIQGVGSCDSIKTRMIKTSLEPFKIYI